MRAVNCPLCCFHQFCFDVSLKAPVELPVLSAWTPAKSTHQSCQARLICLFFTPPGGPPDVGKMLGGEEKEQDPDAAKKEEERQEALRQQEEERKAKYAKMEAERERMRQGIRDKVRWQEPAWEGGYSSSNLQLIPKQYVPKRLKKEREREGATGMCRNSGTRSERRLLKAARYFCLPLFLSEISGASRGAVRSGACEYPSRNGRVRERTVVKTQPPRPHSCSAQAVTREQAHKMPAGRPGGAWLHRLLRAQPQSAQRCGDSERQWGGCTAPHPP